MDLYNLFGLPHDASKKEIKKAYRKLAMQYHPDRPDGDSVKFQKINDAYKILINDESRKKYDTKISNGSYDYEFDYTKLNQTYKFGWKLHQHAHNEDIHVVLTVRLIDTYCKNKIKFEYPLTTDETQDIEIEVPYGTKTGDIVVFKEMGNNKIPNIPRGKLILEFKVEDDIKFIRKNKNLYTKIDIDMFDAILGTEIDVLHIDKSVHKLKIKPNTKQNQKYKIKNLGFYDGDLVVIVNVEVPTIKQKELYKKFQELQKVYKKQSKT